ncbi:MAG: hypothetical protein IH626_12200 [Rhodospirillales bacterium]|nr:hypothetical protein [Rhodospirillales bacterium]
MILQPDARKSVLRQDLLWIREHWIEASHLMHISPEFNLALQAFDQSSFERDPMLALLLLWGALEALFSPARAELRFRVSVYLATFLEPPGPARALLQRDVARLYDARSAVAHGHKDKVETPLIDTYELLKRVLLKIIEQNEVPTIDDIEAALFGVQ